MRRAARGLIAGIVLVTAFAAASPANAAVVATASITETAFEVVGTERSADPLRVIADQLDDGRVRYQAEIPPSGSNEPRGDTLTAGPGCSKPLPTELVECVVPAPLDVRVALGERRGGSLEVLGNTAGRALTVNLGAGDDIQQLFQWDGPATIDGGAGDDVLAGNLGDETLRGGDGNDSLGFVQEGGAGTARVLRGSTNDGNDVLDGGPGDDVLNPHGGPGAETDPDSRDADALDGGPGIDEVRLADYREETTLLVVDLVAGTIAGGRDTGNTIRNVENVDGGGRTQLVRGDDRANRIAAPRAEQVFGGGGNDVIGPSRGAVDGGAGNDVIGRTAGAVTAGSGNDVIEAGGAGTADAGAGNDRFIVLLFLVSPSAPPALGGGAGTDTVEARGERGAVIDLAAGFVDGKQASGSPRRYATLASVENANGTSARDTIKGNSSANVIRGGGGVDQIDPRGGRDTVFSGAGRDIVRLTDNSLDFLDCGSVPDAVSADRIDRLARNCRPRGRGR